MDITVITAFSIAVFLLALTPGPDIVYVAMRGLSQGKKAGVTAAAGLITGVFFHIFIAIVGVSAVLAASPILFGLLKYAGAGYICYLGWNIARSGPLTLEDGGGKYGLWQIYRQTIVMNILNPKVGLFFLAFLPQFVDQQAQNTIFQLVILGVIFQLVSFTVMASVGFFSGAITERIGENSAISLTINKVAGSMVMLLGISIPLIDLYQVMTGSLP